ncbi:uncharacterized protein FYW49_010706 [Xenentodon cancila]
MKPQEAELVGEISKLQCMVTELKVGFTSALLELGQIQHGDTFLREELEENRRSCQKKALRLEALVESLREELGVVRCQIVQLYSNRPSRPQEDGESSTPKQRQRSSAPSEASRFLLSPWYLAFIRLIHPQSAILQSRPASGVGAFAQAIPPPVCPEENCSSTASSRVSKPA